jgi:hypothetical protein
MRADFQPALTGKARGFLIAGEIMPAINPVQRFIICGL